MNEEYEIVSVEEAGIDFEMPALSLVPDAPTYEEAVEEHAAEAEEEQPRVVNRSAIRAAKRAARKHGAGFTRLFRYGRRESKPW